MGVFLALTNSPSLDSSLPHARGGVSSFPDIFYGAVESSPRTWGCFDPGSMGMSIGYVFPTHVGVFLRFVKMPIASIRLPHARGGVSPAKMSPMCRSGSSPRTWGCFRIDPCLRRDGIRLPHARGGVSRDAVRLLRRDRSSPRTWGCFYLVDG